LTCWTADLIGAAYNSGQLSAFDLPEVVVAGRSNVGKSTLINVLLNRTSNKVAYVSSKPGKTRSLNFYRINPGKAEAPFIITDLPGYGYAVRAPAERKNWFDLVNSYFDSKRDIQFVMHLIDFRHGPLAGDMELTEWLDAMGMPRLVIFTKGDKAPKGRVRGMYQRYMKGGLTSILPPLVTTGRNDEETERLRGIIRKIISERMRDLRVPSS
jgi:GTP-binding protein